MVVNVLGDHQPIGDPDAFASLLNVVAETRAGKEDWRRDAACAAPPTATMLPDPFFDAPDHTVAATLCATCPVKASCEEFAETISARAGVWAGRNRTPRRRNR